MKLRLVRLVLVLLIAVAVHYERANSKAVPATPAMPAASKAAADTSDAKPYPFSTSVVSGLALGDQDHMVKFIQNGYQIKLASQAEADTFKQNPGVYLAKIADAYKTAKPCPFTVCPVMGDALDADSYSFVYEGRQFKFCCDGCMDDFEKDPAKFVKMWDDAEKATQTAKQ